jgi:hypothetical protein
VGVDVNRDQVLVFHGGCVSIEVVLTIADAAQTGCNLQAFGRF